MKFFKTTIILSFLTLNILFTGCKAEDMEPIDTPSSNVLVANSSVVNLMKDISSNDGSSDNIIDKSNCFNIKFPLSANVNGQQINVKSKDDYKIIEYIFDDRDDDIDSLNIKYPVIIILEDYSEIMISSTSELNNYSNNCHGENEFDDDIECLDFKYPITISSFNTINEVLDTDVISTDIELNQFLRKLHDDLVVSINFPIQITLLDESLININNLFELENTINDHKNDCDEDDDYDYNDDDCDDCNIEALTSVLTDCNGWTVDQLDRNNINYDNFYNGYDFNFAPDGSVQVSYSNTNSFGTWVVSGTKNDIKVTINIPDLPLCNNEWRLHEISEYSKKRIDFRVNNSDRLRYNNTCN